MGLDPRTPGLRPGPKAGAKPLSHPGIPHGSFFEGWNDKPSFLVEDMESETLEAIPHIKLKGSLNSGLYT